MIAFFLSQLICLTVAMVAPILFSKDDFIEIEINGAFDSLKDKWHSNSFLMWLLMIAPAQIVAQISTFMVTGSILKALAVAITFAVLARAWYWIDFDRRLNIWRKLPEDYIGQNSKADAYLKKHPKAKKTLFIATIIAYSLSIIAVIAADTSV